jgi:hypothetical protein
MNTLKAAQVMTNDAAWGYFRPHIKEVVLRNEDSIEFRVKTVTNEPLRTTICWTDPPGREQPYALNPTNTVLVNDLDLRVISPDGSITNKPWVLNPTNPADAATTGDNIRDNVEQVHIQNPSNGWYTVRVTHKGSLGNGMQDVSIIVTGNTPTNVPLLKLTDISVTPSTNISLRWDSVVGSLYRLETSTNLVQGVWTDDFADDISAIKETIAWTDMVHTGTMDRVRFYRVKTVE